MGTDDEKPCHTNDIVQMISTQYLTEEGFAKIYLKLALVYKVVLTTVNEKRKT